MPILEGFPADDAYWVVKWVDKFTLPHLTTRSTAVSVRLQRLPIRSHGALNRLRTRDVPDLLRLDTATQDSASRVGDFVTTRVLAGALPHFTIGRVFHNQQFVGALPASTEVVHLSAAEQSCSEIAIGDPIPKPAEWGLYPYHLLHASEFDGIQSEYSRSRCLVFADEARGIEFVIPRTVIFQRFYALQRELANAFTSGPWQETKRKIVYESALDSGLKTQVDPATGAWDIILQTHVDKDLAPLVALFYFDDHARKCAESIYTQMLAETKGRASTHWYASARLPFRAERCPLRLQLQGFHLHPREGKQRPDGARVTYRRAFLATSILTCSWPTYPPLIRWEKFNSGEKGSQEIQDDRDRPYVKASRRQPAGSDLRIVSTDDPTALVNDSNLPEDTYAWSNPPTLEKLVKDHSRHYSGERSTPIDEPESPTTASAGVETQQDNDTGSAQHKIIVRDPVNRFRYLLQVLDELASSGDISRRSVLQPIHPSQIVQCGGTVCWSFLDETARVTGRWPASGWRMVERARGSGGDRSPGRPRSALVVRVEVDARTGYWIEIECRDTEAGMLSPFLLDVGPDEQEAVAHAIETIARAKGSNLRSAIPTGLAELGRGKAFCYKHIYLSGDSSALDANSLRRFFTRCL